MIERIQFRDEWLSTAAKFNLKIVYRAIEKRRFHTWLQSTFGAGVIINPHVAAFALVAQVVNDYLASLPTPQFGVFISDDNKEVAKDVEKSIKVLRGLTSEIRLGQVIEKGFFIDSSKSRVLQLCDMCALTARKHEERKLKMSPKSIDDSAISLLRPLVYRADEKHVDVVRWLGDQYAH